MFKIALNHFHFLNSVLFPLYFLFNLKINTDSCFKHIEHFIFTIFHQQQVLCFLLIKDSLMCRLFLY